MHRSIVTVNQVPTEIITCGRWIEEGLAKDGKKDVVIVITGNPGIASFYEEFVETINSKLPSEVSVWVIGHAGHINPPENLPITIPDTKNHRNLYDLKGQLNHKVCKFIYFKMKLIYNKICDVWTNLVIFNAIALSFKFFTVLLIFVEFTKLIGSFHCFVISTIVYFTD